MHCDPKDSLIIVVHSPQKGEVLELHKKNIHQ